MQVTTNYRMRAATTESSSLPLNLLSGIPLWYLNPRRSTPRRKDDKEGLSSGWWMLSHFCNPGRETGICCPYME